MAGVAEGAAQVADCARERRLAHRHVRPHRVQDLLPGDHAVAVPEQMGQHREGLAREGQLGPSRRSLHDHHVTFRSAGGSDARENRVTLCAFHHRRCLHAGRLRVRGRAPDGLVFELGLRAGAPPLARYAAGDVALPPGGAGRLAGSATAARAWAPPGR